MFALVLVAALLGPAVAADGPATVIVGATLVDGGATAAVVDSVLIMRGGLITAVGDRIHTPIPKGASLVDGRRAWLAPAPASGASGESISALVRGPAARLLPGQPAHIALLATDPRGGPAAMRRLWTAGRESTDKR
jgi:hypothetical protein